MKLNIKLALDRVSKEHSDDKTFVKLPYELAIIKNNSAAWVKSFEDDIINDRYAPGFLQICEVPKGNYHIRPGALLSIEDAVYYTALVGEAYEHVFNSTIWARDRYDFSYNLTGDKEKTKWIRDNFNEWKNFRARSLEKIKQGYPYVLVSDISGFYENINIQTLSYDLKHAGVANNVVDAISSVLNVWAQNHGKGLPQGYAASNVLAKLYLNSMDMRLKDDNLIHMRYVDDIRIFCKDITEAKNALVLLTALLRDRGLNLQTSKTKILFGKEATDEIEGVQPIIENILSDLKKDEVKEKEKVVFAEDAFFLAFFQSVKAAISNPYGEDNKTDSTPAVDGVPPSNTQIEPDVPFAEYEIVDSVVKSEKETLALAHISKPIVLDSDPETVDISIIKRTFEYFFINSDQAHFDKTLFRFLIKRLSNATDTFGVNYCKTLFERHPEETATLLKYFKEVNVLTEAFDAIEKFLLSSESIYHYQNYQIIEWMESIADVAPSESLLALIRKWAFDNTKPYYLKSISRKYLQRFANVSDLEMFEKLCKETNHAIEQAEMICVMHKMEKNRRNSTYARIEKKNILNKSAVKYAKTMDASSAS